MESTFKSIIEQEEKLQQMAYMKFDNCVYGVGELIGGRKAIAQMYLDEKPDTENKKYLSKMLNWYNEQLRKLLAL